jgi:hypothetical protein
MTVCYKLCENSASHVLCGWKSLKDSTVLYVQDFINRRAHEKQRLR